MMKLFKVLVLLFIIASYTPTYAQIISISENHRGQKRSISIDDKQIIEINSTLEIEVSKENLLKAIQTHFPELNETVELESKLIQLEQALQNQSSVISILENELATAEEQKTFFEIMDAFLSKIQSNPYLSNRYEELMGEYVTTPSFAEGKPSEPYIFSNLNNDIITIEEELQTVEAPKYFVSLVAFKKDASGGDRVHVQNYDTYTTRDFFTVERWVTSLSEADKQRLQELAEIARENNEREFEIFRTLKNKLLEEFGSIACFINFKTNSIEVIKTIELDDVIPTEIKLKIAAIQSAINQLETLYQLLKTDIRQWNITVFLNIKEQAQTLYEHLKNIDTQFSDLQTLINQTALVPKLTPLVNEFQVCNAQVQQDYIKLQNGIALLFGLQSNYLANKSIGEEVLSFSVDNLPETGYINLKGTGKRQNGDELLVEMILRMPSSVENAPEQVFTLEQHEFTMQLLGARSEVAVGLIFANPFNKDGLNLESDREFFYAPSASLLLKFGSSKSYFYNEFLDFGIGLNFATPDFNTDGSPEFGVGVITTAFKDILSVGINYNTTIDNFYWFFGINLPFNLPGLPVNNIKN